MCCQAARMTAPEMKGQELEPSLERCASHLPRILEEASPLERTYIVSSAALSANEGVRLAIARALRPLREVIGARSALEHLRRDPSPKVRAAALGIS